MHAYAGALLSLSRKEVSKENLMNVILCHPSMKIQMGESDYAGQG